MKNLTITEENLVRSKKQLQKAMKEDGVEISLSKSANLIARIFGYQNEHELQINLADKELKKNENVNQDELLNFYFNELLFLYKKIDEILDEKIKSNKYSNLDQLIEAKCRAYMFCRLFEINKELIISGSDYLFSTFGTCVRFIYNILIDIYHETNYSIFNQKELLIVRHLYNYHNIEPYFLKNISERSKYYLSVLNFEIELSNDDEFSFNYFDYQPLKLERYDKEKGMLYTRKIFDIGSTSKNVGLEYATESFTKITKI